MEGVDTMPSDLSFICIDDQKTYDSLRTYDETETKKQTNKTRKLTKEKRNPAVFARWNPERGEKGKLEIVKRYSLNDEDQDENLKMAKSACIELSIMKHLREANAFACCAELYGSRLINRENDEELCDYEVKELLEDVKKACNHSRKKKKDQEQYWKTFEEIAKKVKEIEITMEYGVSLKRFVEQAQKEKVPIVDAQQKIRMLFEALKVLQHLGIMHQDIKPDNVILVQRDAKIVPVFIDFDVSSFFDNEGKPYVYHEGSTPRYQSPEQAGELKYDNNAVENDEQRVTRATDVYSMAVAACELLDPSFPNSIKERETMLREFARKDELHGLLAQALRFIPEERPTVENIVRKLMEFCGEIPVEEVVKTGGAHNSFDDTPSPMTKTFEFKDTIGAILLAVVAIAIIVGGVKVFNIAFLQLSSPTESVSENGVNATDFSEYNATETHFHHESEKQNSDPSEKNTSANEPSDPAIVTSSEPTEPTTDTSATTATTTSRPVQTTQSSYIPSPPPTTPHHTESAVTPSETHPPETTFATTTTPGVGVENDFEYSLVNGQEAVLTRYIGSQTEVVIPSTLGGLPVAEIGASAFENNAALTRIEFPSSLTTIGDRAFAGCTNLLMTDVAIPMKLTRIGNCAFQNSANGIVKLPSNTSMTEIGERAFYECCATTIVLYNIQTIHNEAFAECNNLDTVYLPISLKTVGNDVFFGKDTNPDMPVLSFFGNNNTWLELNFTDQDPEGNSEDRNRIWQYFETMRAERENEISQNGSSNIRPVLQFNSKYYE